MVYIGTRKYKYRNMIMSHMIADSINELMNMADYLGIDRKYFQDKPGKPHFDISQTKKEIALESGNAIEISDKEIVLKLKNLFSF